MYHLSIIVLDPYSLFSVNFNFLSFDFRILNLTAFLAWMSPLSSNHIFMKDR